MRRRAVATAFSAYAEPMAETYRDRLGQSCPVILCRFFSASRPSLMLARSSGYAPLRRVWVKIGS
jgi:hypothetical protein